MCKMKIAWFCIPAHGHTNPTLGLIKTLTEQMKEAAKLLEFEHAAFLRDKIAELKGENENKKIKF